jgi:hypothetical protein
MSEIKMYQALEMYIEAGADLADSLKRNIQHRVRGVAVIDDETVIKLNNFMKAANNIADLPLLLSEKTSRLN